MDNVFSKLRSTLISTVGNTAQVVSQVQAALPGNNVTKEYEVVKHIASAGPGFLWKVYSGHKKSTKQEAAVFIFEKKLLERYPKNAREQVLENLRRGVNQVTRLRHPNVLVVQHPLDESRDALAFATEPVFASLGNILGYRENCPDADSLGKLDGFKLDELEIKYGLVQLCDGLNFLHRDVKLVHRNIAVESIVVNASGAWKLFGFDFCVQNESPEGSEPFWKLVEYNSYLPPHAQPHMDFLAPEYATNARIGPWCDMYSVGVLMYALFSGGKPLFRNGDNYEIFRTNAGELEHLTMNNLSCIPIGLRETAKMLLSHNPDIRPEAGQVGETPYFQDIGVKTLSYLDAMYQWDNVQKTQFYKGLAQVLPGLPFRVNLLRVVPCLAKEFVNPPMIPFVLGPVLVVAEEASAEEFREYILPGLKPVLRIADPVQITLIFLQRMELLLSKTPAGDVREYLLPVIYRAIENPDPEIQALGLSIVPKAAPLVDYPALKNAMLPKIKTLCLETKLLKTRVQCLLTIGQILENLDRWLVMDEILPFLPKIPSREPAVLMGVLGIYKLTMDGNKLGISKDVLATQVLPFLFPMCIESGLSLVQFNNVMSVIRDMIDRVEADQRPKVEQLDQMRKEQKSAFQSTLEAGAVSQAKLQWPGAGDSGSSSSYFNGIGGGQKALPPVADDMKAIEWHGAPSESSNSKPKPSLKHLSLEEKQRLAKSLDSGSKAQTVQPIVTPPAATRIPQSSTFPSIASHQNASSNNWPGTSVTSPIAHRDLTSSLINSNMNAFGKPSLNQVQPQVQSPTGFLSPFGQQCLPPPPAPSQNTRAFEDLLPRPGGPKVSMNDMMARAAGPVPLAPTVVHSAPMRPAVNALSSKDIDELLR
ncbi:unnamed protein product [Notodromas monacha]|uniref:Protein kinase domain-containing protein n=1 Tax=Notodromas monacha TaxID=399045 RepID=A0A7R9BCI6_9CRUS|nr:unnamed protein product [Notodromas monacha]CAG0912808.1 unnamed protein product [Notodromas monacha]